MRLATVYLFLAAVLVAGCSKPKPMIEDNRTPFSFAGISLGSTKDDIKKKGYELFACKEKGQDNAECLVQKGEEQFGFFGLKASSMSYGFRKPYDAVTGIELFIHDTDTLDKNAMESAWGLKGRCFTGDEIKEIVSNGDAFDPSIAETLGDARVLPYGSSFICMDKDNKFIQVSLPLGDVKDPAAFVEIFYLRDDLADLYSYLFKGAAKHQQTNAEINRALESSGS